MLDGKCEDNESKGHTGKGGPDNIGINKPKPYISMREIPTISKMVAMETKSMPP